MTEEEAVNYVIRHAQTSAWNRLCPYERSRYAARVKAIADFELQKSLFANETRDQRHHDGVMLRKALTAFAVLRQRERDEAKCRRA